MLGTYFSMDRVEAQARCIFKLCFHVVGVWRPHSITWKRDTSGTSMWQANAYTHWQEKLRERLMGNGLGFGLATCCTAWCCLDFSCSCCCFCRLAFNCKSNSSSWSSNSRSCCFRSPEWQHEGHSQCKHETLFCQVTVWNKRCLRRCFRSCVFQTFPASVFQSKDHKYHVRVHAFASGMWGDHSAAKTSASTPTSNAMTNGTNTNIHHWKCATKFHWNSLRHRLQFDEEGLVWPGGSTPNALNWSRWTLAEAGTDSSRPHAYTRKTCLHTQRQNLNRTHRPTKACLNTHGTCTKHIRQGTSSESTSDMSLPVSDSDTSAAVSWERPCRKQLGMQGKKV